MGERLELCARQHYSKNYKYVRFLKCMDSNVTTVLPHFFILIFLVENKKNRVTTVLPHFLFLLRRYCLILNSSVNNDRLCLFFV